MKIEVIGTRGWSYAGAEDLVRELGARFVRDGHSFTIHAWATQETIAKRIKSDEQGKVERIFHTTIPGKYTGQLLVAIKSTWAAAFSDCDLVYYSFIQNGIYSWFPRVMGKKILINVDGMMWKDPKWPLVFRHLFFPIGAYLCILFGNKVITDSYHMQQLYRKRFKINIDWVGYGCSPVVPEKKEIDLAGKYSEGYYIIMSRITPHNLTDILIEGFIQSKSESHLVLAGHMPDNRWFCALKKRAEGHKITFLGLVRDQDYLSQILLNARAYLHGHSLGGINPALVRVVGLDKATICVDTVFNREVVEYPNNKLQAVLFQKNADSVANGIKEFENREEYHVNEAKILGAKVRETMSWGIIYEKYKALFESIL
jgi:glycosyltransferase involved in cell wall biosynthesis